MQDGAPVEITGEGAFKIGNEIFKDIPTQTYQHLLKQSKQYQHGFSRGRMLTFPSSSSPAASFTISIFSPWATRLSLLMFPRCICCLLMRRYISFRWKECQLSVRELFEKKKTDDDDDETYR